MNKENSFYEEIDISRIDKGEVKHKHLKAKSGEKKGALELENTNPEKILMISFSPEMKDLFFCIKIGEARSVPYFDKIPQKIYLRLLDPPKKN